MPNLWNHLLKVVENSIKSNFKTLRTRCELWKLTPSEVLTLSLLVANIWVRCKQGTMALCFMLTFPKKKCCACTDREGVQPLPSSATCVCGEGELKRPPRAVRYTDHYFVFTSLFLLSYVKKKNNTKTQRNLVQDESTLHTGWATDYTQVMWLVEYLHWKVILLPLH